MHESPRPASHARAVALAAGLALAGADGIAHADTLVGAYLGRSWTRDSTLHVRQPALGHDVRFDSISWDDESFRSPPYYGLRAFHYGAAWRGFGVGFDFTHYKVLARTGAASRAYGRWNGIAVDETAPLAARVQRFDISHGVNVGALLALYRRPLDSVGTWHAYAGAGPALYVLHPENTIAGRANRARYETSGVGVQALTGVGAAFGARWGAFLEAKLDARRVSPSVAAGEATTRIRTVHAVFGVSWRFGPAAPGR